MPANFPDPGFVVEQIQGILMSGLLEADNILIQTRTAHGFSMTRALATLTTHAESKGRAGSLQSQLTLQQAQNVDALAEGVRGLAAQIGALGSLGGGASKPRFRVKAATRSG